jgi:hypothetical protein
MRRRAAPSRRIQKGPVHVVCLNPGSRPRPPLLDPTLDARYGYLRCLVGITGGATPLDLLKLPPLCAEVVLRHPEDSQGLIVSAPRLLSDRSGLAGTLIGLLKGGKRGGLLFLLARGRAYRAGALFDLPGLSHAVDRALAARAADRIETREVALGFDGVAHVKETRSTAAPVPSAEPLSREPLQRFRLGEIAPCGLAIGEVQQNPSDPVISDSYHGLGMIFF